jgi:membrane-bound lytic murein transglycosylase D
MAIRPHFLVALIGFSAILAPGVIARGIADPVSSRSTESATLSLDPDFPLLDLPVQQPLADPGSPEPPADAASPVMDPWVEAAMEETGVATTSNGGVGAYPVVLNAEVQRFLQRFTRERREVVGLWVSRSARYMGMMREVLKSRGLPEELAFTAMIESGFNPVAVSRAGAVGLWQFMASTARLYGLRVDRWVDERRDPEKSTFAAASYFRDLYRQFGSWALAQAAYNAGDVKVARAIRATGSTDFWVLARSRHLRQETKEFVPQIQAATLIGRDPLQYGFDPSDTTVIPYENVSVPPTTDLRQLSAAAGVSIDVLRELNPTLVRGMTPPGRSYDLKVPAGTGSSVITALEAPRAPVARAALTTRARRGVDVHVVRPRDTVSSIAKSYGVSVGDVLRWNSLERQDRIRPGDRLRVSDARLSTERPAGSR